MLTDAQCRNATCPDGKKRERLTDSGGLYLEVSPNGRKRWFWKFYPNGKESRMALGSYPAVSLTAARKTRDAAKLKKADGFDPVQARQLDRLKQAMSEGETLEQVAREWYGKKSPLWSSHHQTRELRNLEKDLFPWIGKRRIAAIEPVELLQTLRQHVWPLFAEGRLTAQLQGTFAAKDAEQAFDVLSSNQVNGKLVLVMDPSLL